MAPKRVDPLKAKEAKQKKIAIGGAVLLLAVLGVQGPKTLKMLKGPQPVATPASTSTAVGATPVAPAPAAGTAAAVPAAAAPELSAVADSDLAPEAEEGQLATFERFASKDPFAQQAQAVPAPAPAAAKPKPGDEDSKDEAEKKTSADSGDGDSDGGFTGGGTPAAAELPEATSIAVNGKAENVAVDGSFPAATPTFVLVSVAKDG